MAASNYTMASPLIRSYHGTTEGPYTQQFLVSAPDDLLVAFRKGKVAFLTAEICANHGFNSS